MTKRKLSRQQRWRVEKIHKERSERAGKRDQTFSEQLDAGELGAEQMGTVIAHYGQQVEIEGEDGKRQRCYLRANLEALVTGDIVVWRDSSGDSGVVVAQEERRSILKRPDKFGNLKPVAANIDTLFIVVSPIPEPHANLIDRYFVAAEAANIAPVLLVNKLDLLDDHTQHLIEIYKKLGYPVLLSSVKSEQHLTELKATLKGKTSAFVGQSGVGKSSLVNVLLPGTDTRVGELSEAKGKGKHTTTTAKLFHFPGGGNLIDSPGIREFGLWNLSRQQLEQGFIEFRPFLGACKFRDCLHEHEPGCEILAAIERGEISPKRINSYRIMVSQLETA